MVSSTPNKLHASAQRCLQSVLRAILSSCSFHCTHNIPHIHPPIFHPYNPLLPPVSPNICFLHPFCPPARITYLYSLFSICCIRPATISVLPMSQTLCPCYLHFFFAPSSRAIPPALPSCYILCPPLSSHYFSSTFSLSLPPPNSQFILLGGGRIVNLSHKSPLYLHQFPLLFRLHIPIFYSSSSYSSALNYLTLCRFEIFKRPPRIVSQFSNISSRPYSYKGTNTQWVFEHRRLCVTRLCLHGSLVCCGSTVISFFNFNTEVESTSLQYIIYRPFDPSLFYFRHLIPHSGSHPRWAVLI